MKEYEEIELRTETLEEQYEKNRLMFNKHMLADRQYIQSYYGEKHSSEEVNTEKGVLSLERTVGQSLAILNLLKEKDEKGKRKHTVEQIFDIEAINKEKQDAYDEVVKHSQAAKLKI